MSDPKNATSIYDDLHTRVVSGEFLPGQRLRAETLRLDYACSASSIREALFRLSAVDLVDFQEQRGFRIPRGSAELQDDLTRFRILLECEGACQSIRSGGIEWESRLSAAHHKLGHIEGHIHAGSRSDELFRLWLAAELEFHGTLIDACGSDTLISTHAKIYHQFRQQLISVDKEFEFVPENVEQHRDILEAALAHDEASVREKIAAHLSRNLTTSLSP